METLPFNLAKDIATQLISLSLALVGLTLTFVKEFDSTNLRILSASWGFFLLSIALGIMHCMALTGQAAEILQHGRKFGGFEPSVLLFAQLQVICFGVAILTLVVFGFRHKALELRKKT
jgi:hypothetical protein